MNFVKKHLDDALILAGCGLIVYGISQFSAPAAWIVCGFLTVIIGTMVGYGGRK